MVKEYSLYGGDVTLKFDEGKHRYTVNGKKVVSTTAITKVIDKPALIFWALNEATKWLKKQWMPGYPYRQAQINSLLKESKGAHRKTSKKATDIGTEAHAWVEGFCIAVLEGADPHEIPMPTTPGVLSAVRAFLSWFEEHDVEVISTEQKVYSRARNYSGTFDLLAKVDGKLSIVDFKTSKRFYPEYYLQGSGYAKAYEEEQRYLYDKAHETHEMTSPAVSPPALIEQVVVLRIPKDGSDFEAITTDEISLHYDTFLACLNILRWQERQ